MLTNNLRDRWDEEDELRSNHPSQIALAEEEALTFHKEVLGYKTKVEIEVPENNIPQRPSNILRAIDEAKLFYDAYFPKLRS